MRRTVLTILVLAVALAAMPLAGAVAAGTQPVAKGSVATCTPAADASGGAAKFVGRMRQIPSGVAMQMRFTLLRSVDQEAPKPVAIPDWSSWTKASKPGRSAYVFWKLVYPLVGPADYRARIDFRWLGDKGRVLHQTTLVTSACHQPDVRPNLLAGKAMTARAAGAGQAVYKVPIRNSGATAADPFAVTLTVNGVPLTPVKITGLPAKGRKVATVTGPRCTPGSMVVVNLDADAVVAESDEADNVAALPCPFQA